MDNKITQALQNLAVKQQAAGGGGIFATAGVNNTGAGGGRRSLPATHALARACPFSRLCG